MYEYLIRSNPSTAASEVLDAASIEARIEALSGRTNLTDARRFGRYILTQFGRVRFGRPVKRVAVGTNTGSEGRDLYGRTFIVERVEA